VQALGLTRLFSFETLVRYGSILPRKTGGFGDFGNEAMVKRVDWDKTRAFALPQGPIYINRRLLRDEAEYEQLRDELVQRLGTLTDPHTGQPLLKKIYRREEIYHGPHVDRAPDLLALSHDAYHNRAGLWQPEVFATSWRWKGNNRQKGLYVMTGPGVRQGITLHDVSIADLAPTILHLSEVAVPSDMDGRVVAEALIPDSPPGRRPISFQEPLLVEREMWDDEVHEGIVAERLRGLGYL
jgi:predicted AlkP superfamily phosphohydrolase/phosphomutase